MTTNLFSSFHVTKWILFAVEWQEFSQEAESNCTAIQLAQPYQKVSHKKKCLLSDPAEYAGLDTKALQDLKPGDKYDGPISQKDSVTTSPVLKAVKHSGKDNEQDLKYTTDDI